ncbi:methyl-accepting chemotaxis protein [Fervidobacterium gondwanense]
MKEDAENSQTLSQNTSFYIQDIIKTANIINKRNTEILNVVSTLGRELADLSHILSDVLDIADDITILSLNAAIEANRAGEVGAGFSVVADEIRNLAQEAEKQAETAKSVFDNLQKASNDIANNSESLTSATQDLKKTGDAISQILDEITTKFQDLISSISKQNEDFDLVKELSDQMLRNFLEVELQASQIASATIQSSTALNQEVKTFANLNKYSQNLLSLSGELKSSKNLPLLTQKLSNAARELRDYVQDISTSSHQVGAALNQLTKSSSFLSQMVEKLSNIAGKLVNQSTDITKMVNDNKGMIPELLRFVEANFSAVQDLSAKLININDILDKLLQGIGKIRTYFDDVERILAKIDKIALKTGTLAVSGFIEASRAGEYKKNFIVLSNDIRNLALEIENNAEQMKNHLQKILPTASKIWDLLESSIKETEQEIEKSNFAIEYTEDLKEKITSLDTAFNAMSSELNSVNSAIEESNKALEQLKIAIVDSAFSIEQASLAMNNKLAGLDVINEVSEEIIDVVENLRKIVK